MSPPAKSTKYTVENRSAAATIGTVQNRTWVTNTGPLKLDSQDLMYAAMSERRYSSDPSNAYIGAGTGQHKGFYTTGISDCSVVAIFELGGTAYYFEHVAGSDVKDEAVYTAMDLFNTDAVYAVVAQWYGGVAFESANWFFDMLTVPAENQIYYCSKKDGMGFGVNFVDGTFGEIDV